jgi:hypothetical protein
MQNAARNYLPGSTSRNPCLLVSALVGAVIGSSATKSLPFGANI